MFALGSSFCSKVVAVALLSISTLGLSQVPVSRALLLEPSSLEWKTVPGYPSGYRRAMLEGHTDSAVSVTYRVHLPHGFRFAPHTHLWTEHVTVLEGIWKLGIGKTFDATRMHRLAVGSFVIIPAGVPHFVSAEGSTIVQVHGVGPVGMTVVEDTITAKPNPKSNSTAQRPNDR